LLSVSSRTAGAPRCFSLKSGAITTPPQCKRGCLRAMTYRHVEAVLLLTKLHVERHIEVDVSMDELDVSAAESKTTYNEIRDYVWEHHQLKVSNLYIAQVKQKYSIIERENYNKAKNENAKRPKCPKEKEDAIVEALKHFQMI